MLIFLDVIKLDLEKNLGLVYDSYLSSIDAVILEDKNFLDDDNYKENLLRGPFCAHSHFGIFMHSDGLLPCFK